MNRVLEGLARAWQFIRDVVTVLRPCRFSALVVTAGAALLFSGQGQEFTVRLPAEGLGKTLWFDLCVFLWAFQSWYWARLLLDLTFGDRDAPLAHPRPGRIRAIIVHTPRIIAAGSYLVAAAVCALTGTWLIGVALAIEGALFYAFLVLRKTLVASFAGNAAGWKRVLLVRREGAGRGLRSLPLLSIAILAATLACAAVLTAWACRDAVDFGWTFGAAAVPFLGFSMLVPVGSLLVLWSSPGGRRRIGEAAAGEVDTRGGYPVISLLVLLAIVWSFFPALDNHALRTLPKAQPAAPIRLDDALERWQAQAPRQSDGRSNLVVVATAGGGLRAAYWTATVLGAIQDRVAAFNRQLFAVSGVSGGSLGAAVYVTLASGEVSLSDRTGNCGDMGAGTGRIECAGQAVLSQDFLAPPFAALLFPDLMQRFFPVGFPDRAQALEQSWELAWRRAGFGEDVWGERGFRALWPEGRFVPALLLNSTHVETGKRVIASNLDVAGAPKVFRDAYDLYELLPAGAEIRPSTAAHTSARFTYLSPAGTLADRTHLVDGGYFENFGAVTAREVLKAATDRLGRGKVRPVAVLISNDPELGEGDLPRADPQQPQAAARETWAAEALSPLRALLHTRDARGLLAASELRAFAEENGGAYFQFRLCREAGSAPALGWVLSGESEDVMRKALRSGACGNVQQLKDLLDALRS